LLLVADSTPTLLVAQVGLVGMIGVYGLIAYAAWRDRRTRPVYAFLVAASLTINLPEAFPLNVLLGLLLARSLAGEFIDEAALPPAAPPV
jgi:hypothetical protein